MTLFRVADTLRTKLGDVIMGALTLLALLGGALFLGVAQDGDDSEGETPQEIEDTPVDPQPADTGATFEADETGVRIDVGDDETGTIASIIYVDSEDDPDNFYQTYEARFYLVPEGTDLSDGDFEESGNIPGQQTFEGNPFAYELEDFEAELGLELLGTVPLTLPADGFPLPDPGTMRDVLPAISSNALVAVHYLEATTDGDELITFLNEDYIVTRNGIPEQVVTESTTGTAGADWLTAGAPGLRLAGAAGDDILITDFANTTLDGGAGDDTIEGVFAERNGGFSRIDGTEPTSTINAGDGDDVVRTSNAIVDAGDGDDEVNLVGGEARGGDGDDRLSAQGDGVAVLLGQAGDDSLTIGGVGSQASGGDGNDFVSVGTGGLGNGDAGDDTLQISDGATGLGGSGDDLFNVWNFHDEPTATVTGGEGADTVSALVRGARCAGWRSGRRLPQHHGFQSGRGRLANRHVPVGQPRGRHRNHRGLGRQLHRCAGDVQRLAGSDTGYCRDPFGWNACHHRG
ncbi:calcium-binding protein [Tateyamaria omphalii]|uniref:Calcium-binding protein n=1 Tax=Tateyamaria omphalii TaxID=299262 RepID=A0A1P8MW60_9RHOB|nr:calcium-binding protein [Tateyamaria omphalii]APX12258.1 hypothetical protein BWR18_11640 [Tateyamaria omphalii]